MGEGGGAEVEASLHRALVALWTPGTIDWQGKDVQCLFCIGGRIGSSGTVRHGGKVTGGGPMHHTMQACSWAQEGRL